MTNCCLKCQGLMVAERMTGGFVNEAFGFWQRRCLNCGLIIDLTILHRLKAKIDAKHTPFLTALLQKAS